MTLGRSKTHARKLNLGSISHGTMNAEDLIPAFISELEDQKPCKHRKLIREIETRMESEDYFSSDDADEDLDLLFSALDEYCLPYFYFGAHPGDGSDYGFWLSDDFRQQFEDDGGLVVDDTSEIPKGYRGEVLHVNDHGNMTLYVASARKLREVWAVV